MPRYKDITYNFPEGRPNPKIPASTEHSVMALLMDIRDELKLLNNKLDDLRAVVKRTDRRLAKRMPLR